MSMEQRRPSDVSQEFSLSQERDVLINMLTSIGHEVSMEYEVCQNSWLRGVLTFNGVDEPTNFTLSMDQHASLSEKTYTAILACSSILIGNHLDLKESEGIILPQPNPKLIQAALQTDDKKENHLASLVMAENLLFQASPMEWGEDIKETLNKRPPGWKEGAKRKADALYPLFDNPIFKQSLLPRFQAYHTQDHLALGEI